jgi:hypothetical protein
MATTECTINYRPIRAALLVRDQSFDDLRRAAGIASMLWGGIYNPIVPVGADLKSASKLCETYNVDVLVPIAESAEIHQLMSDNMFLALSQAPFQGIFTEEWHTKKLDLVYLDIAHAIDLLWNRGIKDMKGSQHSNAVLVTWDESDPLATLLSLQYGFYPEIENLNKSFATAFRNGLRAKERSIKLNGSIPKKLSKEVPPIQFTCQDLRIDALYDNRSGVYIGNPENYEDLVTFWNIRATGTHLQFISIGDSARFDNAASRYVNAVTKQWESSHPRQGGLTLHFRTENAAAAEAFYAAHPNSAPKVISPIFPGELGAVERSFAASFDSQRVLANIDYKFDHPAVTMSLPERHFLTARSEKYLKMHWQHLAVSISVLTEFDYQGYTLRVPYIRKLNEFYSRHIAVDPWDLRVEKEAIAHIDRADESSLTLYPILRRALVEKIFHFVGIGTTIGVPGRLTSRIIASMRDYNELDACRVFKIRGVRGLLRSMTAEDTIGYSDGLRAIGSDHFDQFKKLYIARRDKRDLEPADAFNFLVEKRILRPVLAEWVNPQEVIGYRCGACGISSEIAISLFQGPWVCQHCDEEHILPSEIKDVFSCDEMVKWRFKKSGLFALDNNQEGAIPVILALMVFGNMFHYGESFCWTTPMELTFDVPDAEIDMCVMQYKYGREIEIGIGEAKSDGGLITEEKTIAMVAARRRLMALSLNCYLIFAKTNDAFQESELALFRNLRDQGIPVILLGNYELEMYSLAPGERRAVPVTHPFTFSDLELNSTALYLHDDAGKESNHAGKGIS